LPIFDIIADCIILLIILFGYRINQI
jgi:hypothetical protein